MPGNDAAISLVAMVKLVISMAWLITISLNVTMGVAWHRFSAFPNIWFKRTASDKPALGALQPMMAGGKPIDFEEADPEEVPFGVAAVEQFTWKGLLDFTTCTECGRCQSQCPAWNTGKPLSPKLLVLSLRDHAYAKAPYLLAGENSDGVVGARRRPRPSGRSSAAPRRTASSTPTCCGRAPRAARASSSARSTSSTSTTSSTCGATR